MVSNKNNINNGNRNKKTIQKTVTKRAQRKCTHRQIIVVSTPGLFLLPLPSAPLAAFNLLNYQEDKQKKHYKNDALISDNSQIVRTKNIYKEYSPSNQSTNTSEIKMLDSHLSIQTEISDTHKHTNRKGNSTTAKSNETRKTLQKAQPKDNENDQRGRLPYIHKTSTTQQQPQQKTYNIADTPSVVSCGILRRPSMMMTTTTTTIIVISFSTSLVWEMEHIGSRILPPCWLDSCFVYYFGWCCWCLWFRMVSCGSKPPHHHYHHHHDLCFKMKYSLV